jgi:ribonucleoside-triphosphate reductase
MNVIKRDGTIQPYSFIKIMDAVDKAYKSTETEKNPNPQPTEKFLEQLKESVEKTIIKNNGNGTPIEEIQDVIQKELIKRNQYDVVDAFIAYRRKREEIRENKSDLIKQIQVKLNATHVVNQNANLDEASFGGRVGEAASLVCKREALKMMSKTARKNHENCEIYIHDLDSYYDGRHNCLSYPMDTSLSKGVVTRQTDIRSAGSVNAAMQLVAVYFQLQSLQQFGGVSATHLDWTMVPYVRKSFRKHYITEWIKNHKDFEKLDILGLSYDEFHHWIENKITEFYINTKLSDSDFFFDNNNLNKKLKQCALLDTKKETYQASEALYHNLNSLQSRSGCQLPFTSINYGTCTESEGRMITKALLEVSMKGLGKNGVTSIFPCGIFQYKKGINDKPGTPNYDLKRLAMKSTAMRIYPNYANADWSSNKNCVEKDRSDKKNYLMTINSEDMKKLHDMIKENPEIAMKKLYLYINDSDEVSVDMNEHQEEIFSSMGCRTINLYDCNAIDNFKDNVSHFISGEFDKMDDVFSAAQKDGRGNICPVTIILPVIAYLAKKKAEKKYENPTEENYFSEFIKILDKKISEAKDSLLERFNHIASQSAAAGRFMYDNGTMSGYHKEQGIISALKHGTIVIGQIGIAETLLILFGYDHTTEAGLAYAKQIEELYSKRCAEYKAEYKLNFGVYYTPAENLCYTSMKAFKRRFPEYEQENVTYFIDKEGNKKDKTYFTNSIHVPVWKDVDAFEKIDIESQLTGYNTAGCITYVELPSSCVNNIDAVEAVIDYAMEHDIPYFAINIPLNRCAKCNEPIWDDDATCCPKCGGDEIKRLGRITGYLSTTVEHFNAGKKDEFYDRVKHFKH